MGGAPPLLQPGNVFAPTARPVQQTIDVTSDRLVRKAKVQDALYDKIDFFYSQVDQYHLANIDAVVSVGGGDDMNVDTDESVPSLDVPPESIGVGSVRPVTMVGDFKLCVAADKPRSRPAAEIAEVFGRCRQGGTGETVGGGGAGVLLRHQLGRGRAKVLRRQSARAKGEPSRSSLTPPVRLSAGPFADPRAMDR